MRRRGNSYGEISTALGGIPKSTLSGWLRSILLSRKLKQRLYTARIQNLALGSQSSQRRRKREVDAIIAKAKSDVVLPLEKQTFVLMGAALYWAGGTKKGQFEITNSDPLLILFMVKWIEEIFKVAPVDLRTKLNMYSQQDEIMLQQFWSDLCGIPVENFGKSYTKPISKNYKKNNLYYGTIKIIIPRSTDMKYMTFGWIEAALVPYQKVTKNIQRKWQKLEAIERPVNLD